LQTEKVEVRSDGASRPENPGGQGPRGPPGFAGKNGVRKIVIGGGKKSAPNVVWGGVYK